MWRWSRSKILRPDEEITILRVDDTSRAASKAHVPPGLVRGADIDGAARHSNNGGSAQVANLIARVIVAGHLSHGRGSLQLP